MSPEAETFSVVIPTYRRPDALSLTLDALLRSEFAPERFEVLVVDDGSDAETERVVRARQGGTVAVTYIAQPNSGAATARNHGARRASGELVLFCDDDIIVEADHLTRHLETHRAYPDGLVNGVFTLSPQAIAALEATSFGRFRLTLDGRWQAEADGDRLDDRRFRAPLLSACNLAVRRELFWQLGGFDEAFPYAGAEDQALSLSASRAGCVLLRDHGIQVLHNDQTLTFRQFCAREEKSAQTFVVLVRRFPEQSERQLYSENAPVARGDAPVLVLKKAVKWLFSRSWPLALIHRLVPLVERARRRGTIERVYAGVIGLHLFRGVRAAIADTDRRSAG